MRCYACTKLSFSILCDACQEQFCQTTISTRTIGTLDVISFYKYTVLEPLLLTKHTPAGYRIYTLLAELTLQPFIEEFIESDDRIIHIIGIDEYVSHGYSHVACLTHKMHTSYSKPLHASLLARSRVQYAGKDLDFRRNHPRDFVYSGPRDIDVILVDDIITTGITLREAEELLTREGVNVLFALCLADAQI